MGVGDVVTTASVPTYLVYGFPAESSMKRQLVSLVLSLEYPLSFPLLKNQWELLDFSDDVPVLFFRECLQGLGADLA